MDEKRVSSLNIEPFRSKTESPFLSRGTGLSKVVLPFHQRELLPLSKNINYRGRTCNFHGERSSSRGWRGLFNEGIGPRKQSVETLIVISKTTPLYPGQDIMFRECETWKCNHPLPLSLSRPILISYDRDTIVSRIDLLAVSWANLTTVSGAG